MKSYGIFLLCLSACIVHARSETLRDIKKAIRECNVLEVKSGFRKLDDEVESTDELKQHLESLIKVAQRVIENPPMIAPEGSSVARYTKKISGGVLAALGVLGVAFSVKLYTDNIEEAGKRRAYFQAGNNNAYYAARDAEDNVMTSLFVGVPSGLVVGLGGFLLLSNRMRSGLPQAEAVEAYLQNELTYLDEDQDEDY